MLPAHAYPKLKAYPQLKGNFGTAWQNQHQEFETFPGAILMTTNCIQKPLDTYKDRIFTTGLVAWPNVTHIDTKKDFTPVIEKALSQPGFTADKDNDFVISGFARNAILSVAEKYVISFWLLAATEQNPDEITIQSSWKKYRKIVLC